MEAPGKNRYLADLFLATHERRARENGKPVFARRRGNDSAIMRIGNILFHCEKMKVK